MAAESGSRAWGFASPDSDFDVRFLYVRRPEDYLTVWGQRDVIEWEREDSSLDIVGWDVTKALRLVAVANNASVCEWLRSPVLYEWRSTFGLEALVSRIDPVRYAWHYYGMAEGNYSKYLQGVEVSHKKYLYVLRPIAAAELLLGGVTTTAAMYPRLPEDLPGLTEGMESWVRRLLAQKRAGEEIMTGPRDAVMNDYLESRLTSIKERLRERVHKEDRNRAEADEVFRGIVAGAWGSSNG